MKQRGRRVPPAQPTSGKPQPGGLGSYVAPALKPRQRRSDEPIDLTLPRVCFYRAFEQEPGPCPRCGDALVQQYASYLISTRSKGRIADSFMTGSDAGWFCAQCLTIVINTNVISMLLSHRLPRWDVGPEFTVLGLVDLDAIPPEKQHLPLGGDDNPIPLIEFSYEP
jgi:hypothetical protein